MAITRTAKGTASSKAVTTVATLSSVSVTQGTTLVVAIAFDTDDGTPDTVKIGKKEMNLVAGSGILNTGTGMRLQVYRKRIGRTNTRDVTANWSSGPTSKVVVIIATEITEAGAKDVGHTREQDATTDPSSSTPANAPDSTVADTISLCYYASRGPSTDTIGTAGVGHTLGQRVGTTGGSDITLQESYEILSATGTVRGLLTGATSRDWATSVVAFKAVETYKVTTGGTRHEPPAATPHMEAAVLDVEDAATDFAFTMRVPVALWDIMTTQQKTDFIGACCTWHAEKFVDADQERIPIDDDLETDLATFEGDTFKV